VYPCKWSAWEGRASRYLAGISQAWHSIPALSAANGSSPGGNGIPLWMRTRATLHLLVPIIDLKIYITEIENVLTMK